MLNVDNGWELCLQNSAYVVGGDQCLLSKYFFQMKCPCNTMDLGTQLGNHVFESIFTSEAPAKELGVSIWIASHDKLNPVGRISSREIGD